MNRTKEMMALVEFQECHAGHRFALLPDHPKQNGHPPRCPHCMAADLVKLGQLLATTLDGETGIHVNTGGKPHDALLFSAMDVQAFTAIGFAMRKRHRAQRLDYLEGLINSPEVEQFLRGTHLEAIHQIERWGEASDRGKRPADWFWLVGYLAGKALHAATSGNIEKAKHHCISTAAALYNWHCAISGIDTRMAPGSSDVAKIVDAAFPGEGS